MIREAIAKVKSAIATKDVIPWMTHYYVHGGNIHATNGRIVAAAPFPDNRSYLVPAIPFHKSLDKMPGDEIHLELDNKDCLQVRCGRYRASIKLSNCDVSFPGIENIENKVPCPSGFVEKLKAIRPFVSDNATQPFALCVLLDGDHMVATNNVSLVAAFEVGLPEMYCMVPVWIIDFILDRDAAPEYILWDGDKVAFQWSDNSWVRAQLYVNRFPDIAKSLIYDAPQPEWEITTDWRDVFQDVASLTTSTLSNECAEIRLYADKIVGGHSAGDFSVDIETPVPLDSPFSAWNAAFLSPVIQAATHFDPTPWPRACPFSGPAIAGLVMGIRR